MAQNDNVVFKTSTTATIDDLFSWNKSTGQIAAKTDNIPIVPGTVYFTADGHIVHDLAQNNRLWMSKNAYSAIYAEDIAETNTDIANAIKYSIHYVEGPTTDTTPGTWTGTINGITELYDGLTIIYVPAVAGKSPTTTLNINGLGAKTCYYSNTSAMTTHYSVGTPILLTYRNNCWRRADYNSNTTYSAMSVAEMRTGTATSERSIRADYLKTFLSTLGGTNLTLTHSNSAPYLQLNHDPSGITAGTYGNNSQQNPSYGGTFNIPYFTVDTQGHITNASVTTVKIPESDNTDYKVRQTPINSNDNNNYRILLSNSANDTEEDNVSKKYINLQYNPSTNKVTTGNLDLTGNLQVSGNATLNNNTSIENAIVNSLLVNGNSSFINDVNFTQIPTAPTATAGDNTTKLATTAFVATALGAYLPLIGGTMVNTASNRASIIFPAFNGAVGGQSNLSINGATTGDDTADNRANITITTQQNKRKAIYGSSGITIDNTADSTGWAGSFAQIRYVDTSDNLKKIFTALGFKGAIDQLDYIYMGGTYTNPAMKLTPNNTFTFNTNVILTDSQTSSTVGSSLLKIYNSGNHAVGLELQRNSGASWQIVNESGNFIIRQNYTSGSAQTTYNTNTQLSIAYNTGNVTIGGELFVGKTTDTTTKKITTRNSYGSISLTAGSSNGGTRGLYDNTFSRWLIYFSPDETNNTFANGKVYIPKWGGVGSSSQPVYFNSNGEPIAITGSLANDITGNAATATNLSGTKTANYIYAGPSSGNAAAPTFRALVTNDIPNLPGSKITSGTISADRLPKASSSAFGIIKSGTGLSIDNGVASVNLSDLGLSSAMHFIGISSTSISQGGNQNPTIDNNEISVKQNGDVVLWNTQEFVWNGSSWQLLGDENSYKIKQTSVSDPTVASNATAISFISNITQDTNGVITATKKDLQVASTSEPGITQYTADNLNTWLNQLTLGSSDPQDNDYYISQYSNGGTTYTSYHRRPMSKLWNYIRGKADNRYSQTDTKNTAGSTSTNDKIYIIGAKEQSANPQTYSADSTVYISNKSIYANNFIGTAKQSYGLIGITSITNTSGLYFYKGSITNNDPNSTDYTKWSCPNHIANTTAGTNSLILRLLWGNNYFKDIYMSPNSNKILYRQVSESNGTPIAGEWRYIVQSSTNGVGDANTPIYITNSGNATAITGAIANDTTGNAATATTASKLSNTSKIGDTNKPVYFKADGTPAVINYTIDKSVPSNAVFTDRYINTATFVDDSTNTAASPVKMTLTRAGSDTVAVTANIPKVSSSSAGVAPKGTAVSSQDQSTKFLREDGTWAAPSYTVNTNTDEKVKQATSTVNAYRKVLVSGGATYLINDNASERTDSVYQTSGVMIQPSSGKLVANSFETNIVPSATGLQFCKGQIATQEGTEETLSAGQPFYGNSNRYDLWSYPPTSSAGPSTSVSSESNKTNIMDLRLAFNSTSFKDIFMSPNNHRIYTRSVTSGTADSWKLILRSDIEGAGSITQPVYISNEGIATTITGALENDISGTATNATQLISNNRMDYGWNGINYFNILTSNQSAAKVNDTPFSSNVWTHILRFNRQDPNGYYTDLAIPFGQNSIYYKRIAAGSLQNSTTNGGWIKVLDQLNYTSYTVTKTGSGASGTWNINISGSAATATALSSSGTTNQFWRGDNRWSDTLGFIKINNEIKIKGYGDNNNYWHSIKDLATVPLTNDRWHYLPNTTGWIVTSATNGTGNSTTPIYIDEGGITRAITGTISNNTTGNAATATVASKLSNTSAIGSSTQPVYFNSSGQPVAVNKYDKQTGKTTDFVPCVGSDGVMEIGKYIDFHNTSEDTSNYIVRITARDSSETDGAGLTLTGTTVGTFKGNLNGTATKATQDGNGNNIINTYLTKTAGVTNITWDNTNKKLIKTINNSNSDIVTLYAANLKLNNAAVYNTELEIKNIKIGNGSTSTSTKNVKLEYNSTLETLNFIFS